MQLIDALKILADIEENQVSYLVSLGTSPSTDELALQFDDTYMAVKGKLAETGNSIFVDEKVLKTLDSIDSLFDDMSHVSNNSFWDVSSLGNAEWAKVRELAREILQLMST